MKQGDIIRWRGVSKAQQGTIVLSNDGTILVRMDSGHTFHLESLLGAKEIKIIEA